MLSFRELSKGKCIFEWRNNQCRALTEKICRGCGFFKSDLEYEIATDGSVKKKVEPKGNTRP